jgi:signal transduction histidine kinase
MPTPHRYALVLATVVVAALTGVFALRDPFLVDDHDDLRRVTLHSARGVTADITADVRARLGSLTNVAMALPARRNPTRDTWRDLRQFFQAYPSHVLLQWVEPTLDVRWTVYGDRRTLGKLPFSLRTTEVRQAIKIASSEMQVVLSDTFASEHDGRRTAAVVIPLESEGGLSGFVVSALDVERLITAMVSDHRDLGYGICVSDATQELHCTGHPHEGDGNEWAQELPIHLAGATWHVRVWPEPHTVQAHRSALPEITWMIAGLFAFGLAVTVHGARAERATAVRVREARDELERRVSERTAELHSANASLRDLSGRLLQLQDEERRRIARELHDSTAQTLATCAISIESARRATRAGCSLESDQAFADATASIDAAIKDVRTLSYLLHPPVLDELGLAYAVEWYAEGFSARSGIAVAVDVPHALERLPWDVELTLFRILQEALTNVHRHSGSSSAQIVLARTCDSVVLEIEDQGGALADEGREKFEGVPPRLGVGIAGMRERVRQLAGTIVMTNSGSGRSIRVVLPIESTSLQPFVATPAD